VGSKIWVGAALVGRDKKELEVFIYLTLCECHVMTPSPFILLPLEGEGGKFFERGWCPSP
jgi:hypothetical protein